MQLTKNFTVEEFQCRCGKCAWNGVDSAFISKLQALRDDLGFAFKITSGVRCATYNTIVGGAIDSAHIAKKAADIAVSGLNAFELVQNAMEMGFTGFGMKQHGPIDKRFIHLDTYHDEPTIWTYQ